MAEKNTKVVSERIAQVRKAMEKRGITVYMVLTGDYHLSEYAGDYFAEREFLSGFTGSAGTLVITQKESALFTDGRYFVQAEAQLEGSGIKLMRMGTKGVLSIAEYVENQLEAGGCLGIDGRTCDVQNGLELKAAAKKKCAAFVTDCNLTEELWQDRPAFPMSAAYELPVEYCGEDRKSKLKRLRHEMLKNGADSHLICSLDDICWLYNLRGQDVSCNPVIMAYTWITAAKAVLYTQKSRFTKELLDTLENDGVTILPYEQIYKDIKEVCHEKVWIDPKRINMRLMECFPPNAKLIQKTNPTVLMKAVKNNIELENLRQIHIQDGLAVTKFMFWLKNAVSLGEAVTEASAAAYLDRQRGLIEGYQDLSFDTISAYNENAAMMHYHADEDTAAKLKPYGMLLVDSGGQYLKGTTDVTRTFALGEVTKAMKKHFTLVLKGMLNLTHAHFLEGCTGFNLDILARQPLWNEGLDYRCGTGHGVGYLLNVHEAPNGFRWKHNPRKNDLCVLEPGMVTSNEPGVYIEGTYGIRIENEIVCVKDYENEYGTFLRFDTLTAVPIDLDLVDTAYLDDVDRERLNAYHQWVYEKLSPMMAGAELEFLKKYTRKV